MTDWTEIHAQRLLILCLFALFSCVCTVSANATIDIERLEKVQWIQVKGESFSLVSDAGAKQTSELATKLALFRSVFSQVSEYSLPQNLRPVKLIATKHQDTYALLAGSSPSLQLTNGIYFNSLAGNYAIAKLRTKQTRRTRSTLVASLFHEYAHHLSALNTTGEMPLWYSEGLAEFLSTAKFSKNGEVFFGAPRERYVRLLNASEWQSIEGVLKESKLQALSKEESERYYALSWLLVSYSYLVDREANRLNRYLQFLRDGLDVDQAFADSFGMSYAELDNKLAKYAKANRFSRKRFKAQGGDVAVPQSMVLSVSAALTEIGEFLLLGLKDAKRAKLILLHANKVSSKENPNCLALLAAATSEYAEAQAYLQRAKALQADLISVRLASAQLNAQRMNEASNDNKHDLFYKAAVADYEAVLSQDAGNLVALYEVGGLWAANGEIEKARLVFERALAAAPGSTPVREALIILYFHLGEEEQAQNLIASILKRPHLSKRQATEFLEWVERFKPDK